MNFFFHHKTFTKRSSLDPNTFRSSIVVLLNISSLLILSYPGNFEKNTFTRCKFLTIQDRIHYTTVFYIFLVSFNRKYRSKNSSKRSSNDDNNNDTRTAKKHCESCGKRKKRKKKTRGGSEQGQKKTKGFGRGGDTRMRASEQGSVGGHGKRQGNAR